MAVFLAFRKVDDTIPLPWRTVRIYLLGGGTLFSSVIENKWGGVEASAGNPEACAGNRPDPPTPPGSGNAAVLTPGPGKARFLDIPRIDLFGPAGPNLPIFAHVSLCFHLWAPAADKLQFQKKNACSGAARTALILSEGVSDALSCFVAGRF